MAGTHFLDYRSHKAISKYNYESVMSFLAGRERSGICASQSCSVGSCRLLCFRSPRLRSACSRDHRSASCRTDVRTLARLRRLSVTPPKLPANSATCLARLANLGDEATRTPLDEARPRSDQRRNCSKRRSLLHRVFSHVIFGSSVAACSGCSCPKISCCCFVMHKCRTTNLLPAINRTKQYLHVKHKCCTDIDITIIAVSAG